MQLREEIHQTVDRLDTSALARTHAYLQELLREQSEERRPHQRRHTLEEIHAFTARDKRDWGELISQEREDRV